MQENTVNYRQAQFLTSVASLRDLPADGGREVAFAGRSNAGKSSAINALTGRRDLARTSRTPGRTRLLNFFSLDDGRRLVDLPGYGYAKVPRTMSREWGILVGAYLESRESLAGVVVLMDIRHPLTALDQTLIEWCLAADVPVLAVLTKADKLARGRRAAALSEVCGHLSGHGDLTGAIAFSATKPIGRQELSNQLDRWLVRDWSPAPPHAKENAPANPGKG
ncbi:MAG: ribosome biogenesis GTP-binding protein YihA/YsxC [Thiotrichales bacterium]|nr:ribosome biogenesis GTP-binding protein YihA/YsxC [Thiotrichales bacterium]MCY4284063.1 ribosome biogenesis GTP-binding protein YihA/YsxC [Thiotrichales bacterium]MCY4349587.1 ribosome biogenesis GTP-binding protein YihA/YsxC [Thiotrichales bacterium]